MPAYNGTFGIPKTLIFTMVDAGTTNLASAGDWTPVTADARISLDGASATEASNKIGVVLGTNSILWSLALTTAEMSGELIGVQVKDASARAVEDNVLLVTTQFGGQVLANTAIDVLQATNATFTAVTSAAEFLAISPSVVEESTASHFVGRNIAPVKNLAMGGGLLRGQMSDITASSLANSKVKLSFTPMTEALASADYVVIL